MSYECVILFRNPHNGAVGYIKPDEDKIGSLSFPNFEAALKVVEEHETIRAWPYQIVELDEL